MSSQYGSDLPSDLLVSDPNIHLPSENPIQTDQSFGDDIAALHEQLREIADEKNRQRVVIQHRSWKLRDVFQSSEDDCTIVTPTRSSFRPSLLPIPSSPPNMDVETPRVETQIGGFEDIQASSNKRRKLDDEQRSPLKEVSANTKKYAFLMDDSDSEDEIELVHKNVTTQEIQPIPIEIESRKETADSGIPTPSSSQMLPDSRPTSTQSIPSRGLSMIRVETFSGKAFTIGQRMKTKQLSYERIIASKSVAEEGKAKKSYYGIDIHELHEELAIEKTLAEARAATELVSAPVTQSVEKSPQDKKKRRNQSKLWTERYRANKFTDLVGDERTHRAVLHWIKKWDPIVFPGSKSKQKPAKQMNKFQDDQPSHRKVLILAGPPGLGKTTLAHVCAKQAGYEVKEINGSDERTGKVVREQIRDMLATENVRGVQIKSVNGTTVRKAGKPQCIVVDEVDGIVGGSGSQEAGFVKALMDLIQLDQKNSSHTSSGNRKGGRKDRFRMLRPLILVCNDVYHPSLRSLRQSNLAEIIHMRRPPLSTVITRLHSIFEREGIRTDEDGVRRLCESTWGVSTRKDAKNSSGGAVGDIRSVLVIGEWVASKFRQTPNVTPEGRLTKAWIEEHIIGDLSQGGSAVRNLGRGSTKDVVERVFQEDAGFLKADPTFQVKKLESKGGGVVGANEAAKRRAINRLNEMIYASGETDRIVTECFTTYPTQQIQDDSYLTKPNAAYEWLHFYDRTNSLLTSSQEWEIAPYLSSPILAFHSLFAQSSASRMFSATHDPKLADPDVDDSNTSPFVGPSAPYLANEHLKANTASIQAFHSTLSHSLARTYRSRETIAAELLPYVLHLLSPAVQPVVINTSSSNSAFSGPVATVRRADEKEKVARAVECMAATGIRFERSRVEGADGASGGWVYRMEPPIDALGAFQGFNQGSPSDVKGVRFAVRQVLEGEWRRRAAAAGKDRHVGVAEKVTKKDGSDKEKNRLEALAGSDVKRDFFGRVIKEVLRADGTAQVAPRTAKQTETERVWVSFHEGYSNAVRRPITMEELLRGL